MVQCRPDIASWLMWNPLAQKKAARASGRGMKQQVLRMPHSPCTQEMNRVKSQLEDAVLKEMTLQGRLVSPHSQELTGSLYHHQRHMEDQHKKTKAELKMHKRRLSEVQHEKIQLEDQIARQSIQLQRTATEAETQSQKEIIQLLTSVSILTLCGSK